MGMTKPKTAPESELLSKVSVRLIAEDERKRFDEPYPSVEQAIGKAVAGVVNWAGEPAGVAETKCEELGKFTGAAAFGPRDALWPIAAA